MNECKITHFFHCKFCLSEMPEGMSPRDYQSVEVGGVDTDGKTALQVWCKRHECNIIFIEWEGEHWTWHSQVELGVKMGKEDAS